MTTEKPYHKFVRAFEIFVKYTPDGEIAAGNDTIYAGPDPEKISDKDKAELKTLGWIPTERECCFLKFV